MPLPCLILHHDLGESLQNDVPFVPHRPFLQDQLPGAEFLDLSHLKKVPQISHAQHLENLHLG